jgi:hypothetical protein
LLCHSIHQNPLRGLDALSGLENKNGPEVKEEMTGKRKA